jgi:SNF2 family DNA or RNA helicase
MPDAEADAARHALNNGEARVLVCTLQAGGVGLNLTGASTAIFIEKHWNPVTQVQAEDRIHRIGQTEKVHIISLVCPGTVDDLVERILTQKIKMVDAVLQEAFIDALCSASRESLGAS